MSKVGSFFRALRAELTLLFSKHLPGGWEQMTEQLINGLNKAKDVANNPFVITAAALFPDGLGTVALKGLTDTINLILPELEIAKGCEDAIVGITDPQERANKILEVIISRIHELPAKWQGKHWEDMAVAILKALLSVSTTEGKALLHVKLGEMKGGSEQGQ
jgi:hypothetical protein